MLIKADTIGEAWLKCIQTVMEGGSDFHDEDVLIKEILGLTIKINKPSSCDPIIDEYGDKFIVSHTLQKFEKGIIMENRPFTYGDLIYNKNGIDQFEWIVDRLKNKPESKSATISLLTEGTTDANLPCLVLIDAKLRFERLYLNFFFRSQNIVGRQYANLLAIATLQEKLATRLGVAIGSLTGFIASAHIYEYDFKNAQAICDNRKITLKDGFYEYGPKSIRSNQLFKAQTD